MEQNSTGFTPKLSKYREQKINPCFLKSTPTLNILQVTCLIKHSSYGDITHVKKPNRSRMKSPFGEFARCLVG